MSISTLDQNNGKRKSIRRTLQPQGITIPFYPRLAAEIGVNDALLLVQIDYWLHYLRVNVEEIEGVTWLNLSAQEMIERGFEHLSRQNINRTIERLVERRLLRVDYLQGSRAKWLTINYKMVEALGVHLNPPDTNEPSQEENGTFQEKGIKRSNDGAQNSNGGTKGSKNGTQYSSTSIYIIKDHRDHRADLEEDRAGARRSGERKTGPPKKPKAPNEKKINWDQLHTELEADDEKLKDMMQAIAAACQMDLKLGWHEKQIKAYARALSDAGYTPGDVNNHYDWWRSNDWRGKKGDVPRLQELADTLHQSRPKGKQKVKYGPDDKQVARLRQMADPTCEKCEGFGWITTWDPRAAGWDPCTCIEHAPASHGELPHGVVVST
jgi:hypothetical protein